MARGAWALTLVAAVVGAGSSGVGWAASGDRLWEARYSSPGNAWDYATSLASSPDGTRVFVTGTRYDSGTYNDYATVAYDASSGAKLWDVSYDGPANSDDYATSLALSADGSRVFVTGRSTGSGTGYDYATIAYNAVTGAPIWATRYNGPGNSHDYARSLVPSPDGARIFVTGSSVGFGTYEDYATIAYDAGTGAQIWAKRYNGPGNDYDSASSLALSPDGARVLVTGGSYDSGTYNDYATVAYNASSGAQLWVTRYDGLGNDYDYASSLASSPDGTRVFVTGWSFGAETSTDYATVAYNATTGAQIWEARYNGPGNSYDSASSLASSPDGTRVFVTGGSRGVVMTGGSRGIETGEDYATIAYNAATGAKVWEARYDGPGSAYDYARSLAPSSDGTRVFVTGGSDGSGTGYDYATIAYDASSGAKVWEVRYNGPGNGNDVPRSLAPSPDGTSVFVTGESGGDYATIAYDAREPEPCTPGSDVQEDGPLSGPIHGTVEPAAGGLRPTVHQVSCGVVAANGL